MRPFNENQMFYIIAVIVLLFPAVFGGYLLFTPMDRLMAGVAWMRLPMPKEGSGGYSALRLFWRGLGVVSWIFFAVLLYIFLIHKR